MTIDVVQLLDSLESADLVEVINIVATTKPNAKTLLLDKWSVDIVSTKPQSLDEAIRSLRREGPSLEALYPLIETEADEDKVVEGAGQAQKARESGDMVETQADEDSESRFAQLGLSHEMLVEATSQLHNASKINSCLVSDSCSDALGQSCKSRDAQEDQLRKDSWRSTEVFTECSLVPEGDQTSCPQARTCPVKLTPMQQGQTRDHAVDYGISPNFCSDTQVLIAEDRNGGRRIGDTAVRNSNSNKDEGKAGKLALLLKLRAMERAENYGLPRNIWDDTRVMGSDDRLAHNQGRLAVETGFVYTQSNIQDGRKLASDDHERDQPTVDKASSEPKIQNEGNLTMGESRHVLQDTRSESRDGEQISPIQICKSLPSQPCSQMPSHPPFRVVADVAVSPSLASKPSITNLGSQPAPAPSASLSRGASVCSRNSLIRNASPQTTTRYAVRFGASNAKGYN